MRNFLLSIVAVLTLTACVPNPTSSDNPRHNDEQPPQQEENNDKPPQAGINNTDLPLNVPDGFELSEFASNLSGARVLAGPDELGNFWLSRTKQGIITNIDLGDDGNERSRTDVFTGMNNPHGLALDPQDGLVLYIAETDKVSKVRLYTEGEPEVIAELPADAGRHYTRTLFFGPDDRLYVSIGSSCDTCVESDPRQAAVYVMDKDGSNFEQYSTGLRNAVFLDEDPVTGEIWVTEMGRDFLGDDLPPDEINILQEGAHYGWPYCYGDQVRDSKFAAGQNQNFCADTIPAKAELQAHSAPLGLAFVPEEGWPEETRLDLLVAYHGSWNRSVPTGFKIVKINLDDQRNVLGIEDFLSGWLTESGQKLGRPVDVKAMPGGYAYITDDQRGVIYKLSYLGN